MSPHPEAPHEHSLSFLLSQIGGERAAAFAREVATVGLTPRAYGVLAALGHEVAPTQQQLADSLGIHRNNMVALVDTLESQELVERRRDPADRRAFRIHRTAAGTRRVRRVEKLVAALDADLERALGGPAAAQMLDTLRGLADSLGLRPGLHPSMRDQG